MKHRNRHRKEAADNYREIGVVRKNRADRLRVALVYPNTYRVGMSSLGFQQVYRLLNDREDVVCERAFFDVGKKESGNEKIVSAESGLSMREFDLIAFSISFESDYLFLLSFLFKAGLTPLSRDRSDTHPDVIAGGVACFLNPEPVSPFIDCFLLGEAEAVLPAFLDLYPSLCSEPREKRFHALARKVPGVYVPSFYRTFSGHDGIEKTEPLKDDIPLRVQRQYMAELPESPAQSAIVTPDTTFRDIFLIETGRGCPHGCRFCSAGFIYRPPRFYGVDQIEAAILNGIRITQRIGLVGAAVSDLPGLGEICRFAAEKKVRLSFSSLRADAISPAMAEALQKGGAKTATFAPEAGSERMRRVINKGIDEEDILSAAQTAVQSGFLNLRLYFMIGLPTETDEDIEAVVELARKVKKVFLQQSRSKGRMGTITLSVNPFVPKPATPFQWFGMESPKTLKKKIMQIRNGLRREANVIVQADSPAQGVIQALFSKGGRETADILLHGVKNPGNLSKTLRETGSYVDRIVHRTRETDEPLPWDFIDNHISASFFREEWRRALLLKTTPPCPMKPCNDCGICRKTVRKDDSEEK